MAVVDMKQTPRLNNKSHSRNNYECDGRFSLLFLSENKKLPQQAVVAIISSRKLFFYFIFCFGTLGADLGAFPVDFLSLDIDFYLSEGSDIRMAAGSSRSGSSAANFTNSAHISLKVCKVSKSVKSKFEIYKVDF